MQQKINYNIISKYRTELMGIAIIWVYFFHSEIYLPKLFLFKPISFLKLSGYAGVDIFIFLSAFGLMHGMYYKRYSLSDFYLKRFLRILPAYWIVYLLIVTIESILGNSIHFNDLMLNLSTFGFWINGRENYDWFISSLLILYLIFPVFYNIFEKIHNKKLLIYTMIIFSLILCFFLILTKMYYLLIFTTRLPVFFIGGYIGYLSLQSNNTLNSKQIMFNVLGLILGQACLLFVFLKFTFIEREQYGLWWYPFIISTVPICLFISASISAIEQSSIKNIFNKIRSLFLFCGNHSFEIYLLHYAVIVFVGKIIYKWIPKIVKIEFIKKGNFFEVSLYFILTLVLAVPLKKLSIIIQNKFEKIH